MRWINPAALAGVAVASFALAGLPVAARGAEMKAAPAPIFAPEGEKLVTAAQKRNADRAAAALRAARRRADAQRKPSTRPTSATAPAQAEGTR